MNVNKKVVFASVGGVLFLLLVFAAVLLFREHGKSKKAQGELKSADDQLNGFYGMNPFPTNSNVQIFNDNVDKVEDWITQITDLAKRSQVEPAGTKSPSEFVNMLTDVRSDLRTRAGKSGVDIEENFAFGFDHYAKGNRATPDHVPRLMQQLTIIERICDVLVEEKVESITKVEREFFDIGSMAGAPGRGGRQPRAGGRGGRAPAPRAVRGAAGRMARGATANNPLSRISSLVPRPADDMTGEFEDDAIESSLTFAFEFTAKEDSILRILNKLAKNDMFMVITSADIETTMPDVAAEAKAASSASARRRTARVSADDLFGGMSAGPDGPKKTTGLLERPKTRQQRVVLGGKKELPAKVRIELSIHRFR